MLDQIGRAFQSSLGRCADQHSRLVASMTWSSRSRINIGDSSNKPPHTLSFFSLLCLVPTRPAFRAHFGQLRHHDLMHFSIAPSVGATPKFKKLGSLQPEQPECILPIARKRVGSEPHQNSIQGPLRTLILRRPDTDGCAAGTVPLSATWNPRSLLYIRSVPYTLWWRILPYSRWRTRRY